MFFFLAAALSLISSPDIEAVVDSPYTFGAHRGSSVLFTENTLEAIKKAVEDTRYEFIEFDIQYTEDKKIVVYHDLTLFRLQKKLLRISNLTYEELSKMSSFHIPKYEEVMNTIGWKKKINIEIKSQGNLESDKQLVDWIVADLETRGIIKETLLSSISEEVVHYIKTKYPLIKVGQIFWIVPATYAGDFFTERWYQNVSENGADYLLLHGLNLRNYENLLKLKPNDKTLVFWFFNDSMYVVHATKNDKMW